MQTGKKVPMTDGHFPRRPLNFVVEGTTLGVLYDWWDKENDRGVDIRISLATAPAVQKPQGKLHYSRVQFYHILEIVKKPCDWECALVELVTRADNLAGSLCIQSDMSRVLANVDLSKGFREKHKDHEVYSFTYERGKERTEFYYALSD